MEKRVSTSTCYRGDWKKKQKNVDQSNEIFILVSMKVYEQRTNISRRGQRSTARACVILWLNLVLRVSPLHVSETVEKRDPGVRLPVVVLISLLVGTKYSHKKIKCISRPTLVHWHFFSCLYLSCKCKPGLILINRLESAGKPLICPLDRNTLTRDKVSELCSEIVTSNWYTLSSREMMDAWKLFFVE